MARQRRCQGKTKAGARCTRKQAQPFCKQHGDQAAATADSERTPKKARARKAPAEDWRPRFLAALEAEVTVLAACRATDVSRSNVYAERSRNEQFAAAMDEVEERTTQRMEREAFRRATEGWVERQEFDVVDGERVPTLTVTKFSDTLLIFLLKARRPEVYRDNHRVEHVGGGKDGAVPIELTGAVADAAHDFLARIRDSRGS